MVIKFSSVTCWISGEPKSLDLRRQEQRHATATSFSAIRALRSEHHHKSIHKALSGRSSAGSVLCRPTRIDTQPVFPANQFCGFSHHHDNHTIKPAPYHHPKRMPLIAATVGQDKLDNIHKNIWAVLVSLSAKSSSSVLATWRKSVDICANDEHVFRNSQK